MLGLEHRRAVDAAGGIGRWEGAKSVESLNAAIPAAPLSPRAVGILDEHDRLSSGREFNSLESVGTCPCLFGIEYGTPSALKGEEFWVRSRAGNGPRK
jgi:hypothetical protein